MTLGYTVVYKLARQKKRDLDEFRSQSKDDFIYNLIYMFGEEKNFFGIFDEIVYFSTGTFFKLVM